MSDDNATLEMYRILVAGSVRGVKETGKNPEHGITETPETQWENKQIV